VALPLYLSGVKIKWFAVRKRSFSRRSKLCTAGGFAAARKIFNEQERSAY
jgi:hypothetical protein